MIFLFLELTLFLLPVFCYLLNTNPVSGKLYLWLLLCECVWFWFLFFCFLFNNVCSNSELLFAMLSFINFGFFFFSFFSTFFFFFYSFRCVLSFIVPKGLHLFIVPCLWGFANEPLWQEDKQLQMDIWMFRTLCSRHTAGLAHEKHVFS